MKLQKTLMCNSRVKCLLLIFLQVFPLRELVIITHFHSETLFFDGTDINVLNNHLSSDVKCAPYFIYNFNCQRPYATLFYFQKRNKIFLFFMLHFDILETNNIFFTF